MLHIVKVDCLSGRNSRATPMTHTPTPPAPAATSTQRGRRIMVRRARIEHLSMELLRLAEALRLPVPVDAIWHTPPAGLWLPPASGQQTLVEDADNPYLPRFSTARDIAHLVNESDWAIKNRLLGSNLMSSDERTTFAIALLMPTALLATLARQQLRPNLVAHIFQVPEELATNRLYDLGYL